MSTRKPTQNDVAKRAGVSAAAVSAVLGGARSGSTRVGPEARDRVLRAARELQYVVDPRGRNLAHGRTRLAAVFTFESIFPVTQRDFYFPFLLGIEKQAEKAGYDLLLLTSARGKGGGRKIFHDGISRLLLADGAIFLGRDPEKEGLANLATSSYPFVCIGRREVPGMDVPYVAADYAAATAELTALLVELGHRRLLYVGAPDVDESAADREKGFGMALRQVGLGRTVNFHRVPEHEIDLPTLRSWIDRGTTALVLENDRLARSVLARAREAGYQVPDHLSLVVLGDSLDPHDDDPAWTTFAIPREAMGKAGLSLLLSILGRSAAPPFQRILACSYQPGSTTSFVPQHAARRSEGG